MIAVADTSLLNYLILLGRADLLPGLFPRILVPPAVLSELRDPNAPPAVRAWAFQPPVWFEVVPVREIDEGLPSQFGAGEREALSLALETHADILLIDERAGREQADLRKIPVTGTLGILLRANAHAPINIPELLNTLKGLRFRVSPELEADVLEKYSHQNSLRKENRLQ
jgi:predicted nucleic acid-binding protein